MTAGLGAAAVLLASSPGGAGGQTLPAAGVGEADAYLDPDARALHATAMAHRDRVERGVVRYTALVKQRIAAALRTPLRDRTVYRAEAASRVFWERDGGTVIQVLASRQQTPVGVEPPEAHGVVMDQAFDPAADPLLFGMAGAAEDADGGEPDDGFVIHPLGPDAVDAYRFATGDTLTLSLPDGRRLAVVELEMRPRQADPRFLQGALWIEPSTGALVRAVFRLARAADAEADAALLDEDPDDELDKVPGLFKPITFDITMVAVEYALWDGEQWMPRALRAEGLARAGILKAPATFEVSYTLESVTTEASLAREAAREAAGDPPARPPVESRHFETRSEAMAWLAQRIEAEGADAGSWVSEDRRSRVQGRSVRWIVPRDPASLATSPHLPPPVWEDAPSFASQEELEELAGTLADLPRPQPAGVPTTFDWGLDRPDLVRYNRVEGLSVGARASALLASPVGPLSLELTGRLGQADLEPRGSLALTHETLRRKVVIEGYHELRALDEAGRHLGPGNSVNALLFGRDDGEYMQASGAQVILEPPTAERTWGRLRLYAEHQHGVERNTDVSLARIVEDDRRFRPVRAVEALNQVGASVLLAPWWGTDPDRPRGGVELWGQGEGGDARFARARATLRGVVPLAARLRLGTEVAGGTTWGDAPPQRDWLVGGPSTLRGYGPSTLAGPDFARGRLELSRLYPVAGVALFGDAAWAGERDAFDLDEALLAAGVGVSVLDGLIRLDLARALRDPTGWRLDLYLDGVL